MTYHRNLAVLESEGRAPVTEEEARQSFLEVIPQRFAATIAYLRMVAGPVTQGRTPFLELRLPDGDGKLENEIQRLTILDLIRTATEDMVGCKLMYADKNVLWLAKSVADFPVLDLGGLDFASVLAANPDAGHFCKELAAQALTANGRSTKSVDTKSPLYPQVLGLLGTEELKRATARHFGVDIYLLCCCGVVMTPQGQDPALGWVEQYKWQSVLYAADSLC